jgi:hypothetical protein
MYEVAVGFDDGLPRIAQVLLLASGDTVEDANYRVAR